MAFLTALAEAIPLDARLSGDGSAEVGAGALRRAVADLRRGAACVVEAGEGRLVVAAAETAGDAAVAVIAEGGDGARLLLAPGRAAALLALPADAGPVVAVRLAPALLEPARLLGLADPTAPQLARGGALSLADVPGAGAACLALAKLARLLPAMLVVPLAAGREIDGATVVPAADILAARHDPAAPLARVAEALVPLADAPDCRVVAFRAGVDGMEHLAILVGRPEEAGAPLVRIHSECFTGDLLGSLRCDCGPQLRGAIRRMAEEGAGAVLYLAQEGRGIGLVNKLRAYALQDLGMDTLDANEALGWGADERDFGIAAAMLRALGLLRVRLLTNNPRKLAALTGAGIAVERVSHLFASNGVNDSYLAAKVARFGHLAD